MQYDEPRRIIAKNLPPKESISEDKLKEAFEKISKGTVTNIKLKNGNQTAIIEFCDAYSVNVVLKKRPVTLLGKNVQVEIYSTYLETDENLTTAKLMGLKSDIGDKIKTLQQHDRELQPIDQIPLSEKTINQQAELTQKLNAFCEVLRRKVNEAVSENQHLKRRITELSDELTDERNSIQAQKNVTTEMVEKRVEYQSRDTCRKSLRKLMGKSDTTQNFGHLFQASEDKQSQLGKRISRLTYENERIRDENHSQSKQIVEIRHKLEKYLNRDRIAYSVVLIVLLLTTLILLSLGYTELALFYFLHLAVFTIYRNYLIKQIMTFLAKCFK